MRNIWFISDTHFGHENILKFVDENDNLIRPGFDSISHMNQRILDNITDNVKAGDTLYHLGDVYFSKEKSESSLKQLKSMPFKKRLILGNHDDGKDKNLYDIFGKIVVWRLFKDHNFLATHVPIMPDSFRKVEYNAHGHIHEKESFSLNHINLCVEKTNYMPVHIDDVMKYKKKY